jgi:hypothetical protein
MLGQGDLEAQKAAQLLQMNGTPDQQIFDELTLPPDRKAVLGTILAMNHPDQTEYWPQVGRLMNRPVFPFHLIEKARTTLAGAPR